MVPLLYYQVLLSQKGLFSYTSENTKESFSHNSLLCKTTMIFDRKNQGIPRGNETYVYIYYILSCIYLLYIITGMYYLLYYFKVPISCLGILHICNLWILLRKIVIYLVGRKFYLRGLFCCWSWRKWRHSRNLFIAKTHSYRHTENISVDSESNRYYCIQRK